MLATRLFAAALAAVAIPPFQSSSSTLPPAVKNELKTYGHWHQGCPVARWQLRVLTFTYWGFDDQTHTGQLIVNANAVSPLTTVFKKLYAMRFPLRHVQLSDMYGPVRSQPADGDVTGAFSCRQAVPSPCTGGTGTGHWSEHAYGEAVDIDPVENPYVGCGMTRDKKALSYLNRSNVRPGMVTPAVVRAFRSVGWGWGGSWSGNTKDYMHFSATGH
jgi:hypothetical protein